MTTALYRRYRPEAFSELIGQSQVVEPLMAALRSDRVHHAYLFSGPRGCGKTTSARILARCLNCAEGPTDTPCGKCPSCIELSKGGSGSLDVVEIDAASHNGVDDARDLRERAIFAPARDRFKIFILDEAHMVTTQGFNALLKIVEEPPAHVKFIFATTEPEKVIGTIRSRTHHYPFRLVPPGELMEYLTSVLKSEGFKAEPGVMPLVVRAGGGSVRDSLSLLDQLIAGTDGKEISYQRAVALLGFTHDELLNQVIDAFTEFDSAKGFSAVDRVIQSGQDARRFLEDLLERLRDLMLVASLGNDAKAILKGISPEQFDLLSIQASRFGLRELTDAAEATNKSLNELTGTSNPRLQLELLCARILAPAAKQTLATESKTEVVTSKPAAAKPAAVKPAETSKPATKTKVAVGNLTTATFKEQWPEILEKLAKQSRSAWAVAFTTKVLEYDDEVLTLLFQSKKDVEAFKESSGSSEVLRQVIFEILGVKVKYRAKVADAPTPPPAVKTIPKNEDEFSAEDQEAEEEEVVPTPTTTDTPERAGEFVLREVLGAKPIAENR
ncbi:MAG: polymerase subunit gamma/tau [Actinomycetota bacterium]